MTIAPADVPVIILCGGKGTRLRHETELRPKPLVQVGERPILWHIMKGYLAQGFTRFVLCLGYKGDLIREYFLRYRLMSSTFSIHMGPAGDRVEIHDEPQEEWTVTLVETGAETMTGARVHRALDFVDSEVFMLTYGDGLSDVDLGGLLEFHLAHGKLGTVTGVRPSSRFGELITVGQRVAEFAEKPQVAEGRINGGFFCFRRDVADYLSADEGCILEGEPLERLASDGELTAFAHDGFWQCMDTARDHKLLNDLWSSGQAAWKTW
jgi:glucose-1-phosphate cytidylyltransferase